MKPESVLSNNQAVNVCSKRDSSGKCVELNVNEWDAEHIPGGYVGG
jgi:hypothetical protein